MRGETVGWLSELVRSDSSDSTAGADEVVAVIHDQRDARMILLIHAARKLRRNDHRAFQLAVAHILHGLLVAVVGDGNEGTNVRADRVESFANPQRLRAAILVDNGNAGVANFSAERVTQNDQLHQRKIIDASISAGERKNLRISRSTIAIIRFISQS